MVELDKVYKMEILGIRESGKYKKGFTALGFACMKGTTRINPYHKIETICKHTIELIRSRDERKKNQGRGRNI